MQYVKKLTVLFIYSLKILPTAKSCFEQPTKSPYLKYDFHFVLITHQNILKPFIQIMLIFISLIFLRLYFVNQYDKRKMHLFSL